MSQPLHRSLLPASVLVGLCLTALGCQQTNLQTPTTSAEHAQVQANVFTSSGQGHASLAVAADGQAAVVWDSKRQERGSFGVYARLFDQAGQAQSHELHLNQYLAQAQWLPAAAYAQDGSLWVAWESQTQDGSGSGLVARAFAADGTPLAEEMAVNLERFGDQSEVVLAANSHGMWAAWTSLSAERSSLVLRLLRDGQPEIMVDADAAEMDRLPSLAVLANGELLLCWTRQLAAEGADAGRHQLMAQRFQANGESLGDAVALASAADQDHLEGQIVALKDGGFAATWMSRAPGDAHYRVMLQRFATLGEATAPAVVVAQASAQESTWFSGATLAAGPANQLAVAWSQDVLDDSVHGRHSSVFLQRFGTEGTPLGTRELLAHEGLLSQHSMAPRLAWTADDRILAAYEGRAGENGSDGSAANLALALPQGFVAPPAMDLGPAQIAASISDADMLAANPPIWDPNYVPQARLPLSAISGGDFGFEGVPGNGWTPPDPELAVGPADLLVMTNGAITSLSKSGVVRWTDEIESSFGFWGSLGTGGFVFDPECKWDPHARRFHAMACERTGGRSYFLYAVSKDDSPDNGNDWWKYRLDVTALAGGDIDSPNMAVGPDSVLLTADFFGPDKYLIYILDKPSILGGGAAVTTSELITGANQQSMGVPVVFDNDPNLYILQSTENGSNNTAILHAIQTPFSAYSRTTTTISLPTYTYPNQPPQKGSSSRPFLFEPRFWSVAQRNGSIWAVHHVNSSRARVRWYEIDLNNWPTSGAPSLAQNGEIDLGGDIHTYFPSIHVDANNNVAISYARSAANEYISMSRSTRAGSDPPNTMRPSQVVRTSDNAHTSGRWGDYSGTQAEPDIPGVFWGHHEFTSGSTSSWRTWVARYDIRPSGFVLSVPGLVSGVPSTIAVSGATPGVQVYFTYSTTGTGLTPAGGLGGVLSLENPNLAAVKTASGLGDASITPTIPGAFAGTTVWLQAVEQGGTTSNWVQRLIN